MTRCEKILVNAAIVAGEIKARRGRSLADSVTMYLQDLRYRNHFWATPRYQVKQLNGSAYTDSWPHAKRLALANRSHVRCDVLGWWSNEHLKVKDSVTGIVLWECSALNGKSVESFDWN